MVPPGAKKLPPARLESKGRSSAVRRALAPLPPFLTGAVGAMSAELAAGLLVYSTQGFLRSLTIVLGTELLGLGLGIASSREIRAGALGPLRRRWLTLVAAMGAAAAYAAVWGMGRGMSAATWSQALGLALLGGFPLFAVGAVLGAMASMFPGVSAAVGESARPAARPGTGVGAAAALGGAAGVLATGFLGVPALEPTSFFLFGVVVASGAALLHGWIVDSGVVVKLLAEDLGRGTGPVIRVEDRIRGDRRERVRIWTVDGRPATGAAPDGGPLLPWERAVLEILRHRSDELSRVLLLGSVGSGLERALQRSAGREVVTREPWARVLEVRRRLEGGHDGSIAPPEALPGRSSDTDQGAEGGRFDAVVVDLPLLPGGGPLPGSGLESLESAAAGPGKGGILLVGGISPDEEGQGLARWMAARPWSPERLVLLRPREPGESGLFLVEGEGSGGGLLAGVPAGWDDPWDQLGMDVLLEEPGGARSGSSSTPGSAPR